MLTKLEDKPKAYQEGYRAFYRGSLLPYPRANPYEEDEVEFYDWELGHIAATKEAEANDQI